MLEESSEFSSANIYIQPPDNGNDTDEDSGPEDSGGSLDNLTGRQLRAEAGATIFTCDHRKTVIGDEDSETDSEAIEADAGVSAAEDRPNTEAATVAEDDAMKGDGQDKASGCESVQAGIGKRRRSTTAGTRNAKLSRNSNSSRETELRECSSQRKKASAPKSRVWKKMDLKKGDSRSASLTKPAFLSLDMTPASLFEYFFDEKVVTHIVEMSRIYAHQKLKPNFEMTAEEFRAFVAVLLLSGYAPLPRRRMYWEQTSDVRNEAVTGAMSLNRFEEILRYVHLADNAHLEPTDKMAKVRPLFDLLNKRYRQYWPVEEELDIDESMVPYYGHHSSKQFIRGKPIRFGFKIWCLNARLGYLLQFDPYQGASSSYDSSLGNERNFTIILSVKSTISSFL